MFESVKHIDELGNEYWNARELMNILQYCNWQNFEKIIYKAKVTCENSSISPLEHFIDVSKTIVMPKNASKNIKDYKLSRCLFYLIAQTYFVSQTRKMEIAEKEFHKLNKNYKTII